MRRATIDDTTALAALENRLFPENGMNEKTLQNELEIGECWLIKSEKSENILGYCLVRRDGKLLDILRLGVVEEKRGRGMGAQLLEHVLKQGKITMLTVKRDNGVALKLYFKHGFKIVGYLASDNGWIMRR